MDALLQFGDTLRQLRREAEAIEPLSRALQIARRRGERYRVASALGRLALAQFYLGRMQPARQATEEARGIFRSLGRTRDLVTLTLNLAEMEAGDGNTERSIELAREALSETSATRFAADRSTLLSNLSGYLITVGRTGEAIAVMREAIAVTRERQEAVLFTIALQRAALIGLAQARAAESARLHGYVDAAFEALGSMREPLEQREDDQITALLPEHLNGDEIASLTEAGRTMTQDEAMAIAVSILDMAQ